MPQLRVEISDLETGDLLVPSGRRVEENTIDAHTPTGYRDIILTDERGVKQRHQFRSATEVNIIRN